MAYVDETIEFGTSTGRRAKYPWALWLDGRKWVLTYGVDYTCTPRTMQVQAAAYGRRHKIEVKTQNEGDGKIAIRAIRKPKRGRRS